jgi:hypothetical protein
MHVERPGNLLPTRTSISAVRATHPVASVAQALDSVLRRETSVQLSVMFRTRFAVHVALDLDLLPTEFKLAPAAGHTGTD